MKEENGMSKHRKAWQSYPKPQPQTTAVSRTLGVRQVLITPEIAADYLSKMKKNRNVKMRHIQELIQMLRQGEWMLNGETIKFDANGHLVDGQHRLHAILQSGIAAESLVVFGIDPRAFSTIDIGKIRTFGDLAGLLGYENANTLGGALNVLYTILHIEGERQHVRILPKPFLLEYLKSGHEDLIQSVSKVNVLRHLAAPSVFAACHYLCAQVDSEAADRFFMQLHEGVGLEVGSPILVLSKKLIEGRLAKRRYKPVELAVFILKAWNAVQRGQHPQFLKWSVMEQFPRVYGLPQDFVDQDLTLPQSSVSTTLLKEHTPQSLPEWVTRKMQ
jgi:hypothetical protein